MKRTGIYLTVLALILIGTLQNPAPPDNEVSTTVGVSESKVVKGNTVKNKSKQSKSAAASSAQSTPSSTPVSGKKSKISSSKLTTPGNDATGKDASNGKKLAVISTKTSGGTVFHPITPATSKGSGVSRKGPPGAIRVVKPVPASGDKTSQSTVDPIPSGPKAYRPVAWLLHGVGMRLVRERVYNDLIAIQDQKDAEGQLGTAEKSQLAKLRSAHAELTQKNAYLTNGAVPIECRCGFNALLGCEMELHRDYGHPNHAIESGRFDCCQCGASFTRSTMWIATHNERVHGRKPRSYTPPPPPGVCPYCPFEQKTTTKCKLTRHIERCAAAFVADRNLAVLPADCDFPLIDTRPPSSRTTVTVTTAAAAASSKSSVDAATAASSSLEAAPSDSSITTLNTNCVTVSAVESVTTPVEARMNSPPKTGKSKGRPAVLPDSGNLQFDVCELCGAFVRSRQSLAAHLAAAHRFVISSRCAHFEQPPIPCDRCTERFWTPVGLRQHGGRMHEASTDAPRPPPTTVCPLCKRTRLTDVVEHLARQHRITLVDMFLQRYCAVCQLALSAALPFEHHMLTRHAELFADRAALYSAIVAVDHCTRGRSYSLWRGRQPSALAGATRKTPIGAPSSAGAAHTCSTCGTEYTGENELRDHVEVAHAFACAFCPKRFSSAGFLRVHVSAAHGDDVDSCETCGAEVDVADMADHVMTEHVRSCAVVVDRMRAREDEIESFGACKRRHSVSSESATSGDEQKDGDAELDAKRCRVASPAIVGEF